MTIKIDNLVFPFEDYFSKYSDNILQFGQTTRNLALEHVPRRGTVVDIGAHVGISVCHWAPIFQKVIAFEPMVDHYQCLQENTKQFSNVTLHNCAISGENTTLRGTYRTGKNSGSFQLLDKDFQINPRKHRTVYQIPCRRLDEFEFDSIDLVKIDVEGWEFDVLQGARETILKHRPTLMVEFTGGSSNKSMKTYDVAQYYSLIQELGYRAVAAADDDTIYVPV